MTSKQETPSIQGDRMILTLLKEMNMILSLINTTTVLLTDKEKQVIENMIIDFQSNNLLSSSLKTKHAYVNENSQFSKLRYFEESIKKHNTIISIAIKELHSNDVIQIILGLQKINIETMNELESLTVTTDELQQYIQQEYPPLREFIDKYRFVMSTCLLNLITIKRIDSTKINRLELKKLVDLFN